MPHYEFIWTQEITEHLADNDITPEEFEDVVRNPQSVGTSDSTGRLCSFGYANDGRYIICIYENVDDLQILPVTAFEVGERQ